MDTRLNAGAGQQSRWQQFVQGSLLWLSAAILTAGMTAILSFNLAATSEVAVTEDLPAPNDVLAPRSLKFTSAVLTDLARVQASDAVSEIYTPFDSSIGRTQLNAARSLFAFVETVRADTRTPMTDRARYLGAISTVLVEEEVALNLLNLSLSDYESAREEVLNTIDELMREDIRADQLRVFQRSARRTSPGLTPIQENVVANLAPQFIVPTVFPNEEATAQARADAAAAVEPITRTIAEDQRIIRAGDIVSAAEIELLTELGLLRQDPDIRDVISLFLASLLSVTIIALYWQQYHRKLQDNARYLAALVGLLLLFTLIAKLVVSAPDFLAYWYPIATLSMLLAVIFDIRMSLMVTVIMAAVIGRIAPNSLELTVYIATGGIVAVLALRDAQRVTAFFRAGMAAAVGFVTVTLIFQLPQNMELVDLVQQLLYGVGNGILSAALTLVGFFVVGSLFGVVTILHLQDLSRLDHPLLQELLRRAPGTYHHSVVVANLAEQAAERIKANSALVRVGAFYHDIGKMNRPPFFSENQEGVNPHDTMDPRTSARIIASHVTDGLALARRYRLPDRIRDFIAEHHGTRVMKSFYHRAVELADGDESAVDIEQFRYQGPAPRSREAAIVMLSDAIESTSSALRPNTERAIEKLVNRLVEEHISEGQLDNSGLTLGDISQIRASFIETLHGRFHVRVRYPGNEALEEPGETADRTALPLNEADQPPGGAGAESSSYPQPA